MVYENVTEISNKAHEALTETLNKGLETLSLTSEVNHELSGRTVDVTTAIAREGVQYLGDLGGAIRQASDDVRELWARQWSLVQEFPKDAMASSQKAAALYWEGGEKILRLGDIQREALSRFTGSVQNLLEKAGTETREALMNYAEKILALYEVKN